MICTIKEAISWLKLQNPELKISITLLDEPVEPDPGKFGSPFYKSYPTMVEWYSNNTECDPCLNCNNHPNNGGTGFCHCTLPYLYRGSRTITGKPIRTYTTTSNTIETNPVGETICITGYTTC